MKKTIILASFLTGVLSIAQVRDTLATRNIEEVVVSATKRAQKITEVPATINVITAKDIEQFASFNLTELAARQKGIDFVRSGVLGAGFNIRGFNTTFNTKNLQITDDRIAQLIATGLPLGSMETNIKEDTERVEILLGPNGSLYGPNAHNGLISTITKDIFKSQGTTIAMGAGNQSVFTARARHAQSLGKKFAFKVAFEHTEGEEFKYTDTVYVANAAAPGSFYKYEELDLDRKFKIDKFNANLGFKIAPAQTLTAYYGRSNTDMIGVTSAGRNQIKDWSIDILQLKYNSPRWFLNAYHTWSNTDKTYAMNRRTQNYWSFKRAGFAEDVARERSFLESWLPLSATNPQIGIPLKTGALFIDHSKRFNAEAQYNNHWGEFAIVAGTQYQHDWANSEGTYLLDQNGEIKVASYGFYGQAEYKMDGWGFLAAARVDHHDVFGTNIIPKVAVTKKVGEGNFRLTYGRGISTPPILNTHAFLFGGLVLGNGQGFTLSDGTKIRPLVVEKISTIETGYKGSFNNKLFLDVNAYYNFSKDFMSPLRALAKSGAVVTHMGDTPIADVTAIPAGSILTYQNFGKVDTYGLDLGINYYFNDNWSMQANYSYFDQKIDKDDLNNDANLDGKVTKLDIPLNAPKNKFSLGLNYTKNGFFAGVLGRYVQKYDFFSGIYAAANTQNIEGIQITENAKYGASSWNNGPLGGFMMDANAGYNFGNGISVGASATNLFNAKVWEFVGSPSIGTLVSLEVKYNINFFDKKN